MQDLLDSSYKRSEYNCQQCLLAGGRVLLLFTEMGDRVEDEPSLRDKL